MGIAERGQKMEVRKNYMNVWQTALMDTIQTDCSYWCIAACCAPCISFTLRKRALHNQMSRYQCCGGYMPCSGRMKEQSCPSLCLCMEVSCCFNQSVASTRFLLQDEYNIQTTKCDNCLIAFMIILGQIACLCRLIACICGSDELSELAEILTLISDLVHCTVCACMQTQHKLEMDYRHGMPGGGQLGVMMVPSVQSMSRFDQAVPPNIRQPTGLLPPPQGGQPPYGQHPQYAPYPPPPGGQHPQYAPYPPPPGGQHPQFAPYPPPPGGQHPQHAPYPPPFASGYPPNSSFPPEYASHGQPLPPQGYYPPGNPPPPQQFGSGEHPHHPPPPPPQATKDSN